MKSVFNATLYMMLIQKVNPVVSKYYVLKCQLTSNILALLNQAQLPRMTQQNLRGNYRFAFRIFQEQTAIVQFLDYKTAQIDALIAKKQALLAKLAEKRTALISHAVTKGLDPSVPMKDSGVEWLGEIPTHWTVLRR